MKRSQSVVTNVKRKNDKLSQWINMLVETRGHNRACAPYLQLKYSEKTRMGIIVRNRNIVVTRYQHENMCLQMLLQKI